MSDNSQNRLEGKTALVTAAGQGIGRAIAEKLAADGAQVHASDLSETLMTELSVASTTQVDATNADAVTQWVSNHDKIDILVHCVGYVHQGTIEECDQNDWRRSIQITLDSAYLVLGAAIPKMKAHGGSVITISSVASSLRGFPRRAAYSAAKGGIIGLTKACACDYLTDNLRFNSICPGTIDSPSFRDRIAELTDTLGSLEAAEKFFMDRQPSGRIGTPEEVADLAAFLASEDSKFITGQTINIDGGITI